MSSTRYVPTDHLSLRRFDAAPLVPFRMRRLGGETLITNDFGRHAFLSDAELATIVNNEAAPDGELWRRLGEQGFVAEALDRGAMVRETAEKMRFLRYGPNLHIFVVTLRCNHSCRYCHASRAPMDALQTDMTTETAERAVDMAFESTSPWVTFEFQGGEPLANWPIVEHIIEYARQKNALAGKALMFALVTNLSLMTEERLDYLIDRRIQICTSLDGPAALHDENRVWKHGTSHAVTIDWIRRINARYVELGLDPILYKVEALPTITRMTLPQPEALIDHYVEIGCRSIFLRHLDPFGFARSARVRLGYDMAEFLAFYRRALDHIVALNRSGVDFVERTAAVFLTKIIGHAEPNFLDIRSPCGAAIGQLTYNYDGRVFTCDEGRMIDRAGDDLFAIGDVANDTYSAVITNPTVRAMSLASTLDGQPGCTNCAYKPWCGVCPVHNYSEQGSIHGRMADSSWCTKHMGILDDLMARIRRADPFELALFERWATPREQTHFVHDDRAI